MFPFIAPLFTVGRSTSSYLLFWLFYLLLPSYSRAWEVVTERLNTKVVPENVI